MIIVYDSRSGLGKKFAEKIGLPTQDINIPINDKCILVTRNVGLGKIPPTTIDFLNNNKTNVLGVVVNGMKRYGPFYCKAADKIKVTYNLPIIAKIETEGNDQDVLTVKDFVNLHL